MEDFIEFFNNADSIFESFNDNTSDFSWIQESNLETQESYKGSATNHIENSTCTNEEGDTLADMDYSNFLDVGNSYFDNNSHDSNNDKINYEENSIKTTNSNYKRLEESASMDLSFDLDNMKISSPNDQQAPQNLSEIIYSSKKTKRNSYQNDQTSFCFQQLLLPHSCYNIPQLNSPESSPCINKKRKGPINCNCPIHKVSIQILNENEIIASDEQGISHVYVKKSFLLQNAKNNSIKHRINSNFRKNDQDTLSFNTKKACECVKLLKQNNFFNNGHLIFIKKDAL